MEHAGLSRIIELESCGTMDKNIFLGNFDAYHQDLAKRGVIPVLIHDGSQTAATARMAWTQTVPWHPQGGRMYVRCAVPHEADHGSWMDLKVHVRG